VTCSFLPSVFVCFHRYDNSFARHPKREAKKIEQTRGNKVHCARLLLKKYGLKEKNTNFASETKMMHADYGEKETHT
jgi:hypothetical protein